MAFLVAIFLIASVIVSPAAQAQEKLPPWSTFYFDPNDENYAKLSNTEKASLTRMYLVDSKVPGVLANPHYGEAGSARDKIHHLYGERFYRTMDADARIEAAADALEVVMLAVDRHPSRLKEIVAAADGFLAMLGTTQLQDVTNQICGQAFVILVEKGRVLNRQQAWSRDFLSSLLKTPSGHSLGATRCSSTSTSAISGRTIEELAQASLAIAREPEPTPANEAQVAEISAGPSVTARRPMCPRAVVEGLVADAILEFEGPRSVPRSVQRSRNFTYYLNSEQAPASRAVPTAASPRCYVNAVIRRAGIDPVTRLPRYQIEIRDDLYRKLGTAKSFSTAAEAADMIATRHY